MAETNTAPSPSFSGIDFNPDFFTSSTSLTLSEADALYLNKATADTANVLETFTVGILANALQATTATITTSLECLGTLTSNSLDSVGTTLTLGSSNATSVTTSLPFYANSYYLTGTAPTLGKSSMNYYVNYSAVSTGALSTTGARYVYSPASNGSTASTNYFQAGIYEAIIHGYVVQAGGPTLSGCTFLLGVATGTATGTLSTSAQYGTITASSQTFNTSNVGGINLNNFGTVVSHTVCFTLASSAFVNLELFVSSLTAITAGNITFNVYGVVRRIG
jgi:hypothetical protein